MGWALWPQTAFLLIDFSVLRKMGSTGSLSAFSADAYDVGFSESGIAVAISMDRISRLSFLVCLDAMKLQFKLQ